MNLNLNLNVEDIVICDALKKALDHEPPFSLAECHAFSSCLRITGAHDVSILKHFPNLRHLEVTASEISDLSWLEHLPGLEKLEIYACPIIELEPLTVCTQLKEIALIGTLATNADPLWKLPILEYGVVLGQAWDSNSYKQFVAANENSGFSAWEHDSLMNWQFNRLLHKYQVPGRFVVLDGWRRAVIRSGTAHYSRGNIDFIDDAEYAIEVLIYELQNTPGMGPEIFDHLFSLLDDTEKRRADRLFDCHSHRELGNENRVRQWLIDSDSSPRTRQYIESFVGRFPKAIFFREKPSVWLNWHRSPDNPVWPVWFTQERYLLAGIYSAESVKIQFDSELAERIGGDFTYSIEPSMDTLTAGPRFSPLLVARSIDSLSILIVNAREYKKPRLYEGQWSETMLQVTDFRPVVGSYSELLSHIVTATTN